MQYWCSGLGACQHESDCTSKFVDNMYKDMYSFKCDVCPFTLDNSSSHSYNMQLPPFLEFLNNEEYSSRLGTIACQFK